ncbi:serpin family protein [Candidatus Peregrinibacteria bacterium]|nr:serpin family protein [Candidatus Peregrinibacteria bacterium]
MENPTTKPQPTTQAAQQVIQGNNQFALDLYKRYESTAANIFFSPYSISTAFAMSYEGARSSTADQIQQTLHFPSDRSTLQEGSLTLNSQINQPNQKYQLSTANALWAEKTYPFTQEYLDNTEKYYQGKTTNLDFVNATETSRQTINDWVAQQTKDKIKDLIPEGSIDKLTRLVITNAVYFKGDWVKQFDPELTRDEQFVTSPTDFVMAKMMRATNEEATFNYAESDDMQIIELPYSGDDLSMLILLPKNTDETNNLQALEKNLTLDQLNNWKNALQNKRVLLYLPKFKLETTYMLAEDLMAMGMVDAFSSDADFSGMTGFKDLNISAVIHKAFVEVNEEGTEAAAATAIIQRAGSAISNAPVIPTFRADHPFIFIIQQKENGNILFMGRVTNPSI